MNQEKIGRLIAELRKEKNMTQVELGKRLGVTKNAVSKWERGLCLMDMSLLEPLCKILDISIVELLNGEKIQRTEFKEKSEEVVTNTINYSQYEIKKTKYKNILGTILSIILIVISILIIYKFFLLHTYKFEKTNDIENIISGLKENYEIKIYKKTIPDVMYTTIDNIKIRNDFQNFKRKDKPTEYSFTEFTYEIDDHKLEAFYVSTLPQYIDMFSSDDLTFFNSEVKEDNYYKEKFDYADRKYFLLRNDINDDIDFIKYIRDNYDAKSNIFMSKRRIRENYAFNLFTSITIPEVKSITFISGDYNGYIFNGNNSRELHIIRDNKNYVFMLVGQSLISDDYIIDLFSTLEIR